MKFFADLAYGTYLGPFPMIALVGFVTYALIVATAIMASGKRWSKRLRRVPVKAHRAVGGDVPGIVKTDLATALHA